MAKNTTPQDDVPLVVGEPHQQPAVRRLARACIALVRWQRTAKAVVTTGSSESAGNAVEDGHD